MTALKTNVSCFNPDCSNLITIPLEQKKEMFTEDFLKYGKFSLPYCSKQCQEKHQAELKKAKFLTSGTLKNHETALIVKGADTTKRIKEEEKYLITGTVTEQRARCVYEKLISMKLRNKKKYLTSNEVQDFLLNDTADDIKAPIQKIQVTAWRVMNKCRDIFPNSILISRINKRTRCLEFIE